MSGDDDDDDEELEAFNSIIDLLFQQVLEEILVLCI